MQSRIFEKGVWTIKRTSRYYRLTINEGAVLEAPEGKYLTLTVNGVGKQIQPGFYKGDIVLTVSDCYHMEPHGLMRMNKISRDFHSAIVVEDGKVSEEKGVPAIVYGGLVDGGKTEGVYIASEEESFNGILVTGDTEYTINNVKMELDGFGENDFLGVGAGVAAIDTAKVTINDSDIDLHGVTRCAVHVGGDSVVTLNNCTLTNHSPDTAWLGSFSWGVGFCGSNRLAQLADNGTVYYNNCYCKTNGWGVLSIDGSDDGVKMFVKDSVLELSGPRAHGYGAFCIGDNHVSFNNSTVKVNGYPMLLMGMEGKGRAEIVNGCKIIGRRFGAMVIDDDNSIFTISDSSFDTDKSTLVVKASATTINIDNTEMCAKNGVIVQLMDPDESGMNMEDFKIPVGVLDVAIPDRDLTEASDTEDVIINISNSEISGDFYNSTTNIRAYRLSTAGGMGKFHDTVVGIMEMPEPAPGAEPPMMPVQQRHNGDDLRGPKNLGLTLVNTKITGVISAALQSYLEGLNYIDESNRLELSNITQWAAEPVNNGVVVSLDKDSAWMVTETSYITALNIAEGAAVKAPEGKTLTMLVNGEKTNIAPGSFKGHVSLLVD